MSRERDMADEGKGRVSTQGGAGREGQNSITCVEKS